MIPKCRSSPHTRRGGTRRIFKRAALLPVVLVALAGSQGVPARPPARNRIVQPVNSNEVVAIRGNTHPWARAQNDRGKVNDSFKLQHVTITFKIDPEDQLALNRFLQEVQDPSSTNYHKWLTPEQFGARFGLTQSDLNKIIAWLGQQGFTVEHVARTHMWVTFSGTAGQIAAALHTEIHRYDFRGATYYANANDPSVPAAIASVVQGFQGLSNYRARPRAMVKRVLPAVKPHFTTGSGEHFLTPDDFATIYNVAGLYNSGIDGTGESIAIMGQTDLPLKDIDNFRSLSGLPAKDPQVKLIPGPDPGLSQNDISEADLDVEWAGGIARNATIIYVNSGTASGVFDSLQYAVDNKTAPIAVITYGFCEPQAPSSEVQSLETYAQTGNAEGITVIAPSGDSGATDCDEPLTPTSPVVTAASQGLAVDIPASIPEVTGVGGSEFNEGSGNYWNATNNTSNGSALSYIPEKGWNDTSSSNGLLASGGGSSILFTKPGWQTGNGVPNDSHRDVPDLALNASPGHDAYLLCSEQPSGTPPDCTNGFASSNSTLDVVGGTSAGAPTFAAILALINQATNSSQGNINYTLYPLAAKFPDAFHDITTGNNEEPCKKGSKDCPNGGNIGYSSGPGYDQVTGLGSVDATSLASDWSAFSPTTGQGQDFQLAVSPSSLTLTTGASASSTVTVTGVNGFTGAVSVTCALASAVSAGACSLSPSSVNPGSTAKLTVTAPSQISLFAPSEFPGNGWWPRRGLMIVCGLALLAILIRHETRDPAVAPANGRIRWSIVLGLLMLGLAAGSVSCGGGNNSSSGGTKPPPSPVSSSVTVTGTATISGSSTTHSVQLMLTVQ